MEQTKKTTTKRRTKKATTSSQNTAPAVAPKTPNPEGLVLADEFDVTAQWMALPRKERNPETQWDLAHKLGVSPDTVSDWKKLPEFWARVEAYRQDWIKDEIPDVVAGLIKKAKYGSAAEVKLFLQFAGIFTETQKVEHSGQTAVSITYEYPDTQPAPDPDQTVSSPTSSVADSPGQ